jgi:hypothetical protein
MAFEEISVNITLTGAQEAVAEIKDYIASLEQAGKVQATTSKSTGDLAKVLGDLAKNIADNTKVLKDYIGTSTKAASSTEKMATSSKGATDATKNQIRSTDTLTGSLKLTNSEIEKNIYYEKQRLLAIEGLKIPTDANITDIERTTRALIVQRDAIQSTIKAQQDTAAKLGSLAPKLSKFSLYVAGGIAGGIYEGIKQYMNFNKVMTQTFSQANVSLSKQKALTQDVLNITMKTGRSYHDVADALYRVSSATSSWNGGKGASTKQLNALTTQAANLMVLGNVSGGANADAASRIIGAVANSNMKDFAKIKDPVKQTKAIAAMLNAVVGSGDIRMSDLISALGRGVLTSAKSVGLGMKDAGAFLDLLTSHGVSGASAGTYAAHGFQLLTGSTVQNRQWQGAIGLEPGVLEHTMKTQGLGAAATMLYQHMNKLSATPNFAITAGMKQLTGQAAADYMMKKAQLTPEQIAMWQSGQLQGKHLNAAQQQTLDTIRSVEMTAMFGGGRQAMPLITLMQNLPQFKDIVKSISMHSNQATYKKDLSLSMNTPAVQEQKLIRRMQYDLMMFGKKMTPYWLDFLKAGNKVLDFMGKFKDVFVPLAGAIAAAAGIIIATRIVGKGITGLRNIRGGAAYFTAGLGHRKDKKSGDFAFNTSTKMGRMANEYANKRGLMGGSEYQQNVQTLNRLNGTLSELNSLLKFLGSKLDVNSIADMGPGRAGTAELMGEQKLRQYAMTPSQQIMMQDVMDGKKMYRETAASKIRKRLSEIITVDRTTKKGGTLGGASPYREAERARAETAAGGRYEGYMNDLNAYRASTGGYVPTSSGLLVPGGRPLVGSAGVTAPVVGEATTLGDNVGKGILGRLKNLGSGAVSGMGRGLMGGVLGAGLGMMGGMGGGGVGGLLGAAGGVASMFGPWGMAAGAALTMAPMLGRLLGGLFHSGPSTAQQIKITINGLGATTTSNVDAAKHLITVGLGQQGTFAQYQQGVQQMNWNKYLQNLQKTDPAAAKAAYAGAAYKALSSLQNDVRGNGLGGQQYFDINGKDYYGGVKIGGQWYHPNDYLVTGWNKNGTPQVEPTPGGKVGQALKALYGYTAAGVLNGTLAGINGGLTNPFAHGFGLHGRGVAPPNLPNVDNADYSGVNWGAGFFGGAFTSSANKSLNTIGNTLKGFGSLSAAQQGTTYGNTMLNAAKEFQAGQTQSQLAKLAAHQNEPQIAAIHQAAANRLIHGAQILENAAGQMRSKMHLDPTDMQTLATDIGNAIGTVLNNGHLASQIANGIKSGHRYAYAYGP